MVVLSAYLDESGIHDHARVCVVAGYFGGPGQWKRTERAWRKVLRDFDVPDFHAKQFWAKDRLGDRLGPYVGWNEAKDKRFLDGLIEAIRRYKIYPISAAIYVDDFLAFPMNQRRYLTGAQALNGKFITSGNPKKPYFVPFQMCILNTTKYAESRSKAHFFFGLGKPFSSYARQYFGEIRIHPDMARTDRMGDIHFPVAAETPQLQAADLLSYLMYQHTQQRLADESIRASGPLSRCLGRSRHQFDHPILDKAYLQALMDEFKRTRPPKDVDLVLG